MLVKGFIVLVMLTILFNLGSGLYYLLNDKNQGTGTVKALSWRIGLSFALFLVLFVGFAFGIITPHGL